MKSETKDKVGVVDDGSVHTHAFVIIRGVHSEGNPVWQCACGKVVVSN